MIQTSFAFIFPAMTSIVFSAFAATQACEGGTYLNPQLFNGDTASVRSIAEQEMRSFIGTTDLAASSIYSIKQIDEITSTGRAP